VKLKTPTRIVPRASVKLKAEKLTELEDEMSLPPKKAKRKKPAYLKKEWDSENKVYSLAVLKRDEMGAVILPKGLYKDKKLRALHRLSDPQEWNKALKFLNVSAFELAELLIATIRHCPDPVIRLKYMDRLFALQETLLSRAGELSKVEVSATANKDGTGSLSLKGVDWQGAGLGEQVANMLRTGVRQQNEATGRSADVEEQTISSVTGDTEQAQGTTYSPGGSGGGSENSEYGGAEGASLGNSIDSGGKSVNSSTESTRSKNKKRVGERGPEKNGTTGKELALRHPADTTGEIGTAPRRIYTPYGASNSTGRKEPSR